MISVRLILFIALTFLVGCATPVAVKSGGSISFEFNGRVAIRHHGEKSSVGINWIHREHTDDILLLAPLGQTVGQIHAAAQSVTLDYSGKQYQAVDAEMLTEQVLGWHLPLSGLRDWVRAESAPGSKANITRDTLGRLATLQQDGWDIRYPRYFGTDLAALPQRVDLHRGDIALTIFIDEWVTP